MINWKYGDKCTTKLYPPETSDYKETHLFTSVRHERYYGKEVVFSICKLFLQEYTLQTAQPLPKTTNGQRVVNVLCIGLPSLYFYCIKSSLKNSNNML